MNQVVKYSVTDAVISQTREQYRDLHITDQASYVIVASAINDVRSLRTGLEKERKRLKADALNYGRLVDTEAKRITGELLSIEIPLKEQKQAVDDVELARKEEKRLATEIESQLDKAYEENIAFDEYRCEQEEFEKARREKERQIAIEQERQANERAILEERERALAEEKRQIERRKQNEIIAKELKEQAEREARECGEREAREKKAKEEAERQERERQESLLPDKEKLIKFADDVLNGIQYPTLKTEVAQKILFKANNMIAQIREFIKKSVTTL